MTDDDLEKVVSGMDDEKKEAACIVSKQRIKMKEMFGEWPQAQQMEDLLAEMDRWAEFEKLKRETHFKYVLEKKELSKEEERFLEIKGLFGEQDEIREGNDNYVEVKLLSIYGLKLDDVRSIQESFKEGQCQLSEDGALELNLVQFKEQSTAGYVL